MDTPDDPFCVQCDAQYARARLDAGYDLCLTCGDAAARAARKLWTVAPLPKSNYVLITDQTMLKGLNSSHRGNR